MDRIEEPAAMVLPRPNLPLLRKVLDHIDAHPDEWDQARFAPTVGSCQTTYCVAGHAVAMTVGTQRNRNAEFGDYDQKPADGLDWESSARFTLGLTATEASDLFYRTMTPPLFDVETQREAVQVVAERIAARAGEVL